MTANAARVLVVDDEEANRDILATIVQALGYDAAQAEDGEVALGMVESEDFDLILLDVMMPQVNGIDALKQIREKKDRQQLPIILITAMSAVDAMVNGLESGANDYITKPFNFKEVRVRVKSLMQMKKLYDERQRLLNTMQHANELKNRLMRIASHDLKNPVNNLSMVVQLLEPAVPDNAENKELMGMAYRYIEVMNSIIEEFLDLDVLKDQEVTYNIKPFALDEVVLASLTDYRAAADRKGIRLTADLDSATIEADEDRIGQVIGNLVSNAVKYSHPNTTVNVTGHIKDDIYELHIMDQGDGIPAHEADALFQPFGKLSTEPTGGENSTGLGLWIVQQLIQAQGGTVGVNLEYTGGADFWLKMPIVED
ncbi:MAG: hybrid sensor histidine kinase/response regulator [Chloroflexota bacterium]